MPVGIHFMNTRILFRTIFLAAIALYFSVFAAAQETPEVKPQETPRPPAEKPQDIRQKALMQLGLSREQVQQIRRLNQERKPQMDEAQRRLREANAALDAAIYADQVNDADVEARMKEALLAHAEVAKLRFSNEYAVRKVLRSEQLVRFREIRQRFGQIKREMEERRKMPDDGGGERTIGQPGNQPVRQFIKENRQKPN